MIAYKKEKYVEEEKETKNEFVFQGYVKYCQTGRKNLYLKPMKGAVRCIF